MSVIAAVMLNQCRNSPSFVNDCFQEAWSGLTQLTREAFSVRSHCKTRKPNELELPVLGSSVAAASHRQEFIAGDKL
jgi:hypothetical protein